MGAVNKIADAELAKAQAAGAGLAVEICNDAGVPLTKFGVEAAKEAVRFKLEGGGSQGTDTTIQGACNDLNTSGYGNAQDKVKELAGIMTR